ncbi:hypothetical protein ACWCYZ_04670 [Streptomyces virginiae]
MNHGTPFLPVLASTDLDIYNADRRATSAAVAGIAATTPAGRPISDRAAERAASIQACRREDLPPLTPRAIAVLVEIAEMKEGEHGHDENFVKFLNYVANLIWRAGDSKVILAEVAELISGVRAEAGR